MPSIFAATAARLPSSCVFAVVLPAATWPSPLPRASCMPASCAAAVASALSRPPWRTCCSWRWTSCGAVAACSPAFFFSSSAPVNAGSLDFASCSSVTPASAIWPSTCAGPCETSVSAPGRGLGSASAALSGGGGGACGAGGIGVTGLGCAALVSGGASVVSLMAFSDDSLPFVT